MARTRARSTASRPAAFTARTADKHVLYQLAVQTPDLEAEFLEYTFRRLRGRDARILREDFCGTSALCCEWVRRHPEHHSIGVDICAETLRWGETHNLSQLEPKQRERLLLHHENVLHIERPRVDILVALNFSYFVFQSRALMQRYFRIAHRSLQPDGLFVLDAFGGTDALRDDLTERRRCRGFTYLWEHAYYNPINSEVLCHIHFEFPDGSRMRKAFSYHWRLWSLCELQELLSEAGFSQIEVYWEGTNPRTGQGNGQYSPTTEGEAIKSWVAYLIAQP
ncbi:MAG: hypothetical protein HJJLKODD_01649 [Phycisphaerae bacterium]|nr:hypothetical protein [Phycisphaerae bacterium]